MGAVNSYTAYMKVLKDAKDRPKDFLPAQPPLPPILDNVLCEMMLVGHGYRLSEIREMSSFDVKARILALPLVTAISPHLFG